MFKKTNKNHPEEYRQMSVQNKTFYKFYLFCEANNCNSFTEALELLLSGHKITL